MKQQHGSEADTVARIDLISDRAKTPEMKPTRARSSVKQHNELRNKVEVCLTFLNASGKGFIEKRVAIIHPRRIPFRHATDIRASSMPDEDVWPVRIPPVEISDGTLTIYDVYPCFIVVR